MGLAFSRIILVFSKQLSVGTQTPWKYLDKKTGETQTKGPLKKRKLGTQTPWKYLDKKTLGTQTSTKFTEKLTNFGTVELSSAETFDQACNICDLYTEKEAVGFCCVCVQYMCYQCCKHHEKIYQSRNHKIVGKEDFENVGRSKEMFDMQLVPLIGEKLPKCLDSKCKKSKDCYHQSSLLSHFAVGKNIYLVLNSGSSYYVSSNKLELFCITEKENNKKIRRMNDMTTENLSNESIIIEFFTVRKCKDIWLLIYMYLDDYVSFKHAFTVTGECNGVVPFNNGLAICIYIKTGFSLPDWQIQYVDFKGNLKMQIYYDSDGKPLFKDPVHIASNYTKDILFVSDHKAKTVIALGTKGEVIYKFAHETLQYPAGLTCDEENNVYVACGKEKCGLSIVAYGKNVIQIDKHGKKSRVILESKSENITNLCYNRESRRLAVIEYDRTVTIFTFH